MGMIKVYSRSKIPYIDIMCGKSQEVFASLNIGFAIVTIDSKTTSHKHTHTEEIYYILKGKGILTIGKESASVQEGDLIPIPIGQFHILENTSSVPIELIVITHPPLDPSDAIEQTHLAPQDTGN